MVGLVTSGLETSVFLASGGETSGFSVLVLGGSNPVDSSVSSDGLVVRVDEDDFVELVGSVLTNPVRIEDSKVSASSANSLLSDGSVGSGGLELVDTLVNGLSVDNTLGNGSLSTTSFDSDSVDDIALLGLVAELSSLIGSAGSVNLVDDWELSVFPGSHSEDESHNVGLLLSPQLFKILVGSHLTDII